MIDNVDVQAQLTEDIQYNCDISDARDHGIYSMCSMVLKLRNLYKWQKGLEPWNEPETADLLDWIDMQEQYWHSLQDGEFKQLSLAGRPTAAHDVGAVNDFLQGSGLFYGAGLGRSLKAIFFLGDIVETRELDGYPVVIIGRERVREMASPFAMVQDENIVLRYDQLRFFLWDHIQEMRGSERSSFRFFLDSYGLLFEGRLDQLKLRAIFEQLVESEVDLFLHHELGELRLHDFGRDTLKPLIAQFQGSVIEFVGRAVKDILADTDPHGLLHRLVAERRASTLALYVSFQDGMRERLFPELTCRWKNFVEDGDWTALERAISRCWSDTRSLAARIEAVAARLGSASDKELVTQFNHTILQPLGLDQVEV